jgi:hypothetical protein
MDLTPHFAERDLRRRGEPLWGRNDLKRMAWNLEVLREQIPIDIVDKCAELDDAHAQQHQHELSVDLIASEHDLGHLADVISALMAVGRMEPGRVTVYEDCVHYDLSGERTIRNTETEVLSDLEPGLDIRRIYRDGKKIENQEADQDDDAEAERSVELEQVATAEVAEAKPRKKTSRRRTVALIVAGGIAASVIAGATYWWMTRQR